jgi:AcrR family transcriptional regulator
MATPVRGMSSRAVKAEQTRQQILETAQRLFAEFGYDATSIQMIADEMGLTKAAVYYHFRAKIDMLHAAMQPGIDRLARLLDEAESMRGRRARAEYMIDGLVTFLVENRHYTVMAMNDPAAKRDEGDKAGSAQLRQRGMTVLFGPNPTGVERLSYLTLLAIPQILPELVDLTDDQLRDALRTTMMRIVRAPS